jgi:hypothetical protein
VDADILSRIDDLDREEEERLVELSGRSIVLDTGLTQEEASTLGAIRNKKKLLALQRRMNPNTKGSKHTAIPRMVGRGPGPAELDRELEEMGAPFDSEVRVRARSHASIREGRDASRAKSRERSQGSKLRLSILSLSFHCLNQVQKVWGTTAAADHAATAALHPVWTFPFTAKLPKNTCSSWRIRVCVSRLFLYLFISDN